MATTTLSKQSIQELGNEQLEGKVVLVRVDFNVPIDNGVISDDTRIRASLPSIRYLIEHHARVVLVSHLGRPGGSVEKSLSLSPIAEKLSHLLGKLVQMAPDSQGEEVRELVRQLGNGELMLLENIRFHKGETSNSRGFAKDLASLADVFVQDAFGSSHRAHASTTGVAKFLPSYAGLLVQKEIQFLNNAIQSPERPLVAIIGGAKVSTKIGALNALLDVVDVLVIGGAMVFTFLKAQGYEVGKSLWEENKLNVAKAFLKKAESSNVEVVFPVDQVVSSECSVDSEPSVVSSFLIPEDEMGLDIGPESVTLITDKISSAKTVVWNGPLGVFEVPPFSKGTFDVARYLAQSKVTSIVGGGDLVSAFSQLGLKDLITHVSTGGGASLEFLEGRVLPGIDILRDLK